MREMSRAIRLTAERYAPTLRELSDDVLEQFSEITWALSMDLRDELKRRKQAAKNDGEDAQAAEVGEAE